MGTGSPLNHALVWNVHNDPASDALGDREFSGGRAVCQWRSANRGLNGRIFFAC